MEMKITNKTELLEFYKKFYERDILTKEELLYIDIESEALNDKHAVAKFDDNGKFVSVETIDLK